MVLISNRRLCTGITNAAQKMADFSERPGLRDIVSKLRDAKRVVVLTGAGVSCASGIPDFRSPGGLYDTLKPDLITATAQQRNLMRVNPTAVVDIRLFSANQFPYLEVLYDKGLLQRLYSQNIDGLDFQMMLPEDKIVNLHGSLAEIQCEFCGADYPAEQFRDEVRTKVKDIYNADPTAPAESSNICCLKCQRPGVKPATVMYGSDLPKKVWSSVREDFPDNVDFMIVAGTSLTVSPACNLVTRVADDVPRLVMNRDIVGEELGLNYEEGFRGAPVRDAIVQGDCDTGFLWVAQQLGWVQDLRQYQSLMCPASAALLDQADAAADP